MFSFGKNWRSYINSYLNDERIEEAKKSLSNFLGIDSLEGKTFIDIGCGSGLFSLAAIRLKADRVVSLDIDKYSVECTRELFKKEGSPENWKILEGSALDNNFLESLGKFDIVYSWGVLHHTGSMWEAIDNTSKLVDNNGYFYIAIYNKADGLAIYPDGRMGPSGFWKLEKKYYSLLPGFVQNIIDYALMSLVMLLFLFMFKNPYKVIKNHKNLRGMSWRIDVKDWLGGYPYEYASVTEIFNFFRKRGFVLENISNTNGLANNEFLLKKYE